MNITIRQLTLSDIEDFKNIRLELLKDSPTNFGSSYNEESKFKHEMWENRLTKDTVITLGLYNESQMIGVTVLVMNPRSKMKHIANINSVYVKPEYRGLKLSSLLISEAIEILKELGIERVNLSVVSDNQNAIKLYEKHGFETYGLEKDTIKYDGGYYSLLLMTKKL